VPKRGGLTQLFSLPGNSFPTLETVREKQEQDASGYCIDCQKTYECL
jgi:hypothetical protein